MDYTILTVSQQRAMLQKQVEQLEAQHFAAKVKARLALAGNEAEQAAEAELLSRRAELARDEALRALAELPEPTPDELALAAQRRRGNREQRRAMRRPLSH